MIIQEQLENNLILTYSDANVYIHGGFPEGNYTQAIDPANLNRTYIETDIPIEEVTPDDQSNPEDDAYAQAGRILMGVE